MGHEITHDQICHDALSIEINDSTSNSLPTNWRIAYALLPQSARQPLNHVTHVDPRNGHGLLYVLRAHFAIAELTMDDSPGHDTVCARAMPPSALRMTTTSGGARQAVSRTKPTRAIPKSPGVLTELVHTGL